MENFKKRINRKLSFKYFNIVVTCLAIPLILVYIYFSYAKPPNIIYFIILIAYFFILLLLNKVYWKYDVTKNKNVDEIIKNYIQFFSEEKLSDIKYIEVLTWFSRTIMFYRKSPDKKSDKTNILINRLSIVLRTKHGLIIAMYHKKQFQELCKYILENSNSTDFVANITEKVNDIKNNKVNEEIDFTKFSYFKYIFLKGIVVYALLFLIHTLGCYITSESFNELVGNILQIIPQYILLVMIYYDWIIEKKD